MSGYFEGRKIIVIGGSSGMGRQTAVDVVGQGANAVIVGRQQAKVDETVAELGKKGKAWGITADLADRKQVEDVQAQLAAEHADATLLVNAAGFFIPREFLDYSGENYDAYLELPVRPRSS
ncbi:SDR family NAD(P)-dependent oxidoreductase [Kribbella sp. CA-245084]|uniref:SDR family NAD(P)-dependent oxidoreductase n=1 Tax=Kribbella sp. CA-245084 TaxID=3239940 RepID=UPI003D8E7E4B